MTEEIHNGRFFGGKAARHRHPTLDEKRPVGDSETSLSLDTGVFRFFLSTEKTLAQTVLSIRGGVLFLTCLNHPWTLPASHRARI